MDEILKDIIQRAKALQPKVVELRRQFHMYPELKYEEVRTSSKVKEVLRSLGYRIKEVAGTGVVASLGEGKPVLAFRADMDALPIQEENDVPYKSRIQGKMHACGHDAHTAMLLGASYIIKELHDKGLIKGKTKLIFQPAEEGGLGAKKVVESGAVDDVDAFFGIHVWSSLPSGVIGIREGPLLASADAFRVIVRGRGGHAAQPNQAVDPIVISADLINAYQKIISREINPLKPAVVTVASLKAGTTFNVIPETSEMLGTIRTFDENVRNFVIRRMKEVTEMLAKGLRAEGRFEVVGDHIPPTVNDPKLANYCREVLKVLGDIEEPEMTMGAEDFAFYAMRRPSVFILLGIRNKEKGIVYPHHHPKFDVDEDVLWKGVAIHSILAYRYSLDFSGP